MLAEDEKSKRKRKHDNAQEAQQSYKKMCERAMATMDKVDSLLAKVERQIGKK